MQILLDRLYTMQAELDAKINEKFGINPYEESYFLKRITALQIEICEFTNETRFFKFWSENQELTTRALEEYVDGLHFFLSIANLLEAHEVQYQYPNDATVVQSATPQIMFVNIMRFTTAMYNDPSVFVLAFMAYLDFGYLVGFEWETITKEYERKYQINIDRQESGY